MDLFLEKFKSQSKVGKTAIVVWGFIFGLLFWQIYPPLPDYPIYSISFVFAFAVLVGGIYYLDHIGKTQLAKWSICAIFLLSIIPSYLFNFSYNFLDLTSWFLLMPMVGMSWLIGWLLTAKKMYISMALNFAVVISSYLFFGGVDNADFQIVHFSFLIILTIAIFFEHQSRDKNRQLQIVLQKAIKEADARLQAEQETKKQAEARATAEQEAKKQAEARATAEQEAKEQTEVRLQTEHELRLTLDKQVQTLEAKLAAEQKAQKHTELIEENKQLKKEIEALKQVINLSASTNGNKKTHTTVIGKVGKPIRTEGNITSFSIYFYQWDNDKQKELKHDFPVDAPTTLCQEVNLTLRKKFLISGPMDGRGGRRQRILADTITPLD